MYWINGILQQTRFTNNFYAKYKTGFFTTALVKNGSIILFKFHIERLLNTAKKLLNVTLDVCSLNKEISLALANKKDFLIMKIIICYQKKLIKENSFDMFKKSLRIILFSDVPLHYIHWRNYGIKLNYSPIRLNRNAQLAGMKHLDRSKQVLIYKHIKEDHVDEALVLDTSGYIIECCNANIFWRYGKKVFTPLLNYAGVHGIMRNFIINIIPKLGYTLQEVIAYPKDLNKADEIFITNAIILLAPVNVIKSNFYLDRTLFKLLISEIFNKLKI